MQIQRKNAIYNRGRYWSHRVAGQGTPRTDRHHPKLGGGMEGPHPGGAGPCSHLISDFQPPGWERIHSLLFQTTRFVVLSHGSPRKLIQWANGPPAEALSQMQSLNSEDLASCNHTGGIPRGLVTESRAQGPSGRQEPGLPTPRQGGQKRPTESGFILMNSAKGKADHKYVFWAN